MLRIHQNKKVRKMQNMQNMQLCKRFVLPKCNTNVLKNKRNAISLIEFGMDSGTDNSSAVRAIIVTVLPKPILFGRGIPFSDESSVY